MGNCFLFFAERFNLLNSYANGLQILQGELIYKKGKHQKFLNEFFIFQE